MARKIEILDTTTRDGLQARGTRVTEDGAVKIAEAILRYGPDVLEAGIPASSPEELRRVQNICELAKNTRTRIAAFAICKPASIRAAHEALTPLPADRGIVSVLTSVSRFHVQALFDTKRPSYPRATQLFTTHTKMAAERGHKLHVYLEDATRAHRNYLADLIPELADIKGVETISVPDTVGWVNDPRWYGDLIRFVIDAIPVKQRNRVGVSVHTHNDLGLAVANAIEGLRAGATRVEGTLLGYGERIGNADLIALIYNLIIGEPSNLNKLFRLGITPTEVCQAVDAFIEHANIIVSRKQQFVGGDSYRTKSGIHQSKLLKNLRAYLALQPENLGFPKNTEVMSYGRGTGISAIQHALGGAGFSADSKKYNLRVIAERVQELAKVASDGELEEDAVAALALNALDGLEAYKLVDASYNSDVGGQRLRCAIVDKNGTNFPFECRSEQHAGLVPLIDRRMEELTGKKLHTVDGGWQVQNIGAGEDSVVFVRARMRDEQGLVYQGLGMDRDTNTANLQACVRAFSNAVSGNKCT